ncbi:MAG: fibrobacter succinogenes major paralogous domain-containing protein [Cyclobacteriaceae bacterium]
MKNTFIRFLLVSFALPGHGISQEILNNSLESLPIGNQEWAIKNLEVTHFNNGDPLYEANSFEEWENACIKGLPAWCYYNNNPEYGKKYGKLYNWWALIDPRGLIPEGWHIPSEKEWAELADYLGGMDAAGEKMKSGKGWKKAFGGDNASGFAGIPGGYRSHEGSGFAGGPFYGVGSTGIWWSSSRYLVDNGWCFMLSDQNQKLDKVSFVRTAGLSVRFIKD